MNKAFHLFVFFLLFFLLSTNVFAQFSEPELIDGCISCLHNSSASGDLDGDGDLDFVVVSIDDSKIIPYINDGQNNFSPDQTIDIFTALSLIIIEIKDYNGDGAPDILVYDSENPIYFYVNDGTGNFTDTISTDFSIIGTTLTLYPQIQSTDYDEDGDIDFIITSADNLSILVYLNDGSGIFSLETTYELEVEALAFFLVDMDTDGDEDIYLVTNNSSPERYWMEKQANNEYNEALVFASVSIGSSNLNGLYFLEDYNGDGWLDGLVFLHSLDFTGVVLSQGELSYDAPNYFSTEGKLESWYNSDYDNDGDIDLVGMYSVSSNKSAMVFENPGNGIFLEPQTIFSFEFPLEEEIVLYEDFNGDDIKDYLLYSTQLERLGVQSEYSDGSLSYSNIYTQEHRSQQIYFKDVDGDGKEDMIRYDYFSSGSKELSIFFDFDENGFNNELLLGDGLFPDIFANNIDFADFDNDGDLDILTPNALTGDLAWYEFTGTEYLAHIIDEEGRYDPFFIDFNNDGNLDIVTSKNDISLENDLILGFQGTGTGELSPAQIIYSIPTGTSLRDRTMVDIEGDGDLDFIGISDDTLGILLNNGDFDFTFSNINIAEYNTYTYDDFNGDGIKDIVVSNEDTDGDILRLHLGQSDGLFSETSVILNDFNTLRQLRGEDFDNDGDLDLFFEATRPLTIFIWESSVGYIENLGNGIFSSPTYFDFNRMSILSFNFHDINDDGSRDLFQSERNRMIYRLNYAGNPVIKGRLFADANLDGLYTEGEHLLTNVPVSVESDPVTSYTDGEGLFRFYLNPGVYTVSVDDTDLECWELVSDTNSYEVEITSENFQSDTLDFAYQLISDFSDMESKVVFAQTRCGFEVPFWLSVENIGCKKQESRYAIVLDPEVTFGNSAPEPTAIVGDTLFFETDSLFAEQSEQAIIILEMPGVESLGEFIDFETIAYVKDEAGIYTALESNFYSSQINCAYDPNDKLVSPANTSFPANNYTLFGEEFSYTVRFQNTGTDTAFNVVIRDTLDSHLDWTTFRPVGASHYYQTEINKENGAVSFSFPDILLPDSMVNEINSHGFIQYKISPLADLDEFDVIENTAHIYFDFNPAIITNTAVNTMISAFFVEANVINPTCKDSADGQITTAFPYTGQVNYTWNTGSNESEIMDLSGGTYNLTITDFSDNILVDTSFILESPIELLFGSSSQTPEINGNTNGSATVIGMGGNPPYTYLWNTIPPQATETATNLAANTYSVTLTDATGCSIETEITVDEITGVSDISSSLDMLVYPVPTQEFVNVKLLNEYDSKEIELVVSDVNGKVLKVLSNDTNLTNEYRFRMEQEGVYFLTLKLNNGSSITKRFVVIW